MTFRGARVNSEALDDLDDLDENVEFKFPNREEMRQLPENMQRALTDVVYDTFRSMLLPRIEFLIARKRRRAEALITRSSTQLPSAAFLLSLSIFSKWSNVEEVHSRLELRILHYREVLQFEGDRNEIVYIVVSGSLQARKKRPNLSCKGFPDVATVATRSIDASPNNPRCINEKVFFTEEPCAETLRVSSSSICKLWCLRRGVYEELLEKQAREKQEAIRASCYATRRELIPLIAPVDVAMLRSISVLSSVPGNLLTLLQNRLEPRVFAPGEIILRSGVVTQEAVIVARGSVLVKRPDGAHGPRYTSRGAMLGDVAMLFVKKSLVEAVAETVVDAFLLAREVVVLLLSSTPYMEQVLRAAHKLEAEAEVEANLRYLPLLRRIPFVECSCADAAQLECVLRVLLENITTGIYASNATITSASTQCDRIIVPVSGVSRISARNIDLQLGESIGFTCLVAHRWKYHVSAQGAVQTLELRRETLRSCLKPFPEVLEAFVKHTKGALFPLIYPEYFHRAVCAMQHCVNPPMFLPSTDVVEHSLDPRSESSAVHSSRKSGDGAAVQDSRSNRDTSVTWNDGLRPPVLPATLDETAFEEDDELLAIIRQRQRRQRSKGGRKPPRPAVEEVQRSPAFRKMLQALRESHALKYDTTVAGQPEKCEPVLAVPVTLFPPAKSGIVGMHTRYADERPSESTRDANEQTEDSFLQRVHLKLREMTVPYET